MNANSENVKRTTSFSNSIWKRPCVRNSIATNGCLFSHEGTKARRHEGDEEETFCISLRCRSIARQFENAIFPPSSPRTDGLCTLSFSQKKTTFPLSFLRAFVPSCLRVRNKYAACRRGQWSLGTRGNYWVLLLLGALCFLGCAGNPSRNNAQDFNYDSDPAGDTIRTAKLITGFDYRKNREKATNKDISALRALFRFTVSKAFVGAGADQHCDVLQDLLRLWGDRAYAHVLANESPKIRGAVISALDYCNDPDWKARKFPATYALAKHEEIPVESPSPRPPAS